MAPPFENLRDGETMEVALDRSMSKKKKKKKSRQVVVLEKKRSTDGSFPKKGRQLFQLFVAAKMAPPLAIFWVRH
jgi:hypothetical protein